MGTRVRSEAHRKRMLQDTRRLARALKERGARLVVLFGSLAHNGADVGSDVDLVVVMPGVEGERFHKRLGDLPAVEAFPHALDLLVYSPAEWERVRQRTFFRDEVLGKGVVLHGRPAQNAQGNQRPCWTTKALGRRVSRPKAFPIVKLDH